MEFILTTGDLEISGQSIQMPADNPEPFRYSVTFRDTFMNKSAEVTVANELALGGILADWLRCDFDEDAHARLSSVVPADYLP